MSTFGTMIKVSLFGESHGEVVGMTIHHLKAGIKLDLKAIENALLLRKPNNLYSTTRKECDQFDFISGFFEEKTTGAPLTVLIKNKDIDSSPYSSDIPRPGHADYPASVKYHNHNDYRGGGHFSGRLTAPLVILGEISKQILANDNIRVYSHIKSIKNVIGKSFYDGDIPQKTRDTLNNDYFPVLNPDLKKLFINEIKNAYEAGDSVGGIIETMITGVPIGLGEPFFDSYESILTHLIFSIPSVKGIEFGRGFNLTRMNASIANDPLSYQSGHPHFTKNDMGGILGGLSNGENIIFSTAIKPTPTIKKLQQTIHRATLDNIKHQFSGRHDTCIVPRALQVVNALSYYATLELLTRKGSM